VKPLQQKPPQLVRPRLWLSKVLKCQAPPLRQKANNAKAAVVVVVAVVAVASVKKARHNWKVLIKRMPPQRKLRQAKLVPKRLKAAQKAKARKMAAVAVAAVTASAVTVASVVKVPKALKPQKARHRKANKRQPWPNWLRHRCPWSCLPLQLTRARSAWQPTMQVNLHPWLLHL
jgi:hypothetical protein